MISLLGIGIAAFALFILQKKFYERYWNHNLKVSLHFTSPCIFEGEQGQLQEIVENRKKLPLPMLKVKFQTDRHLLFDNEQGSRTTDHYYRNDVFHIGGGEKITRTLSFQGGRRGYYDITGIDLVSSDLFMTSQMIDSLRTAQYLYVYPRPFNSKAFRQSLQQLNGEVLARRHLLEDPFEYRGIREYQPFDDMRSINWKATAKTGDLKVNQRGYTALKAIRIFFNIEDSGVLKKEDCVEASLQIAAGLSQYFLHQGISVSCCGNGVDIISREPTVIPSSAGKGQQENIYRALSRVDTSQNPFDFVKSFGERLVTEANGTITCIVAPNHYEPFCELLRGYLAAGQDFTWFYPVWEKEDPTLPSGLEKHIRIIHIREPIQ